MEGGDDEEEGGGGEGHMDSDSSDSEMVGPPPPPGYKVLLLLTDVFGIEVLRVTASAIMKKSFSGLCGSSLVPRLLVGGERKSLVSTVHACT